MNVINILENGMTNIDIVFADTNRGGCGLVAQAMYTVLAKLNVDVKVVLVTAKGDRISTFWVDKCIAEQNAVDINDYFDKILPTYTRFGDDDPLNRHLVVEVDGKLYDSRGEFEGSAISEALTPATLANLIAADCWNASFGYSNCHIDNIPAEMLLQVEKQFNEME